jgi:cytochrome P450
VDFDRTDKRSLIFGRGPHQCIGAYLARTELRVFLTEWLARIPDFAVAPGKQPRVASGSANSVHYLPLVWPVNPGPVAVAPI